MTLQGKFFIEDGTLTLEMDEYLLVLGGSGWWTGTDHAQGAFVTWDGPFEALDEAVEALGD